MNRKNDSRSTSLNVRKKSESARRWRDRRERQSGQASLLSLLAAVALIAILFIVLYLRHPGGKSETQKEAGNAIVRSENKSVLGAAMDQGKGVDCMNNLHQIRDTLKMDADSEEGGNPPSLQMLKGIPDSMKRCPASGKPYFYDPRTGQVKCLTPGHERL